MSGEKGGKDPPSFVGFSRNNISYKIVKHDDEKKKLLNNFKKVTSNLSSIEKKSLIDETANVKSNNVIITKNIEIPKIADIVETEVMNTEVENDLETFLESKKPVYKYKNNSNGPFEVCIEAKERNKNIGNLHILSLSKMVFELNNTNVKKINRKGKNRIGVCFQNYSEANDFVELFSSNTQYNAFIPYNKVSCKGIVKYVDKFFKENELFENSRCYQDGCEVVAIRRLNRKQIDENKVVTYVPTSTICVTFTGTKVPKELEIWGLSFPVLPYLMPVVQCYNCLLYGHTKKLCRGKKKCKNCGEIESENHSQCDRKCFHCNSTEHDGFSRECPEFARQKRIKEIMSFENKSFFEASEVVPHIPGRDGNRKQVVFQSRDFPQLVHNSPQTNFYDDHELWETHIRNDPTLSYKAATMNRKERKTDSHRKNSWDWEEHNKILVNPNGRSTSKSKFFAHPQHGKNNISREELATPRQREDIPGKMLDDIFSVATKLSVEDMHKVLNFMTQFNSISILPTQKHPDEPSTSRRF